VCHNRDRKILGDDRMYHARFKGNHYQVGCNYGSMLLKNGVKLNVCPTFPVDNQRTMFAMECVTKIKPFYPEIIEEIRGIADGNEAEFEFLCALILSMYCYDTNVHCSCFAYHNGEKTVLGRNSDFLVSIEKLYMNVMYELDGVYRFTGNTTAFVEMEDGVNEYGLAVGLTFVPIKEVKPGFNVGIILRYLLEKCKTVEEAVIAIKKLPIASGGTLTIADATGEIAVVEIAPDYVHINRKHEGYIFSTNFFRSDELNKLNLQGFDNWNAFERYNTMKNAFEKFKPSIEFAKNLLSGEYGFICQYDRKKNADTVWSVIYDLTDYKILRVEGNPSRKEYQEDNRFSFNILK